MAFFRKVEDHIVITLDHTRLVLASIGAFLFVALVFLLGVLVGKTIWSYTSEMEKRFGAQDWPKAVIQEERPKGKPLYTFYDEVKGQGSAVPEPSELKPLVVEEKHTPTAIVPVPVPAPQAPPPPVGEEPPRTEAHARPAAEPAAKKPEPAAEKKPLPAGELPRPSPQKAGATAPKTESAATAPKAAKAEAAKPAAPAPAPAAKGQVFSIQLEAYNEKAKADAAAKKMSAKGVSAEVSASKVGGTTWYRIHVGRYTTRDAAEKAKKDLKAKGFNGMIISR